jgi:hypothetical protein
MNKTAPVKQENNLKDLPPEIMRVLEILDKIEDHTAKLKNELMLELKPQSDDKKNIGSIHIKLDSV